MKKNEMFRDWEFRYRYIYRKRRTKKSKQRFLSALVSDIYSMRTDVTVIAYDTLAYRSKNIYVGDIEKAEKVICTYYDTPVHALGSYFMFDWKDQRKKTIYSILLSFILLFSLGWWGMMIYNKNPHHVFDLLSVQTGITVLAFGSYFFLLGKAARGWPSRQTFIRNTSSILTMLEMIRTIDDPSVAYAFVDEGCYGEKGLDSVRSGMKKEAILFYLDSVGADTPLQFSGNYFSNKEQWLKQVDKLKEKNVNYIFSARKKQAQFFYLTKTDLRGKTFNWQNANQIIALFR
ncbi:TPA: hypothetical protein IZ356_001648 [Enterococcus faecium]|nr:hypothetical protein [Enterococcus faecium]EOK11836.1 hypothetical protein WOY_01443 [Enterococcus faecium EnGen0372]KEI54460.1 hypothetical protein P743_0104340 [Enterococcus faecium UC8733]EGP4820668.1 hypothetical protein [Enterococcus faecium]EGP4917190.1 hypothetical protein [Enterococcus faecium]